MAQHNPCEEAALAMYHQLRECLGAAWRIVEVSKHGDARRSAEADASFCAMLELFRARATAYQRLRRGRR